MSPRARWQSLSRTGPISGPVSPEGEPPKLQSPLVGGDQDCKHDSHQGQQQRDGNVNDHADGVAPARTSAVRSAALLAADDAEDRRPEETAPPVVPDLLRVPWRSTLGTVLPLTHTLTLPA